MYFTYILVSHIDRNFYIGFTDNVERRLIDHNSGKVQSTQKRRPFKLLGYEAFASQDDALRRERYFKTTKGKVTIRQMFRDSLVRLGL